MTKNKVQLSAALKDGLDGWDLHRPVLLWFLAKVKGLEQLLISKSIQSEALVRWKWKTRYCSCRCPKTPCSVNNSPACLQWAGTTSILKVRVTEPCILFPSIYQHYIVSELALITNVWGYQSNWHACSFLKHVSGVVNVSAATQIILIPSKEFSMKLHFVLNIWLQTVTFHWPESSAMRLPTVLSISFWMYNATYFCSDSDSKFNQMRSYWYWGFIYVKNGSQI